jgi:hypothetical protein
VLAYFRVLGLPPIKFFVLVVQTLFLSSATAAVGCFRRGRANGIWGWKIFAGFKIGPAPVYCQ